jgi:hypothetical protein
MNIGDIIEFRTTWKNEFFFKNKSALLTAKRLIKKSVLIGKKINGSFNSFSITFWFLSL